MTGSCAQCRRVTEVSRYRLALVGLRYLCLPCFAWTQRVGMVVDPVTDDDPRTVDRAFPWRRRREVPA